MAGMTNVGRLIHHSPARYLASLPALYAAVEATNENLHQSLGSKVPDSIVCEAGADVRVLGIGSGSGEADGVILRKILRRHNSVYNRVVEPSTEMIERYKALVREDSRLGAVKFDWRQQTAEEYFQTKENTKFHLVHGLQVLFHVKDIGATLRNMWGQLGDSGHMLVSILSGESDLGKLWNMLWEDFGQGDRLKTSYRMSCDVKQWLDTETISYMTSADDVIVNVTECFTEGSEEGKLLLDFLTQTPYVANEPKIASSALDYIRHNSSTVHNKIILKPTNEYILAFKQGRERNVS